jgi:hypothetical protein
MTFEKGTDLTVNDGFHYFQGLKQDESRLDHGQLGQLTAARYFKTDFQADGAGSGAGHPHAAGKGVPGDDFPVVPEKPGAVSCGVERVHGFGFGTGWPAGVVFVDKVNLSQAGSPFQTVSDEAGQIGYGVGEGAHQAEALKGIFNFQCSIFKG